MQLYRQEADNSGPQKLGSESKAQVKELLNCREISVVPMENNLGFYVELTTEETARNYDNWISSMFGIGAKEFQKRLQKNGVILQRKRKGVFPSQVVSYQHQDFRDILQDFKRKMLKQTDCSQRGQENNYNHKAISSHNIIINSPPSNNKEDGQQFDFQQQREWLRINQQLCMKNSQRAQNIIENTIFQIMDAHKKQQFKAKKESILENIVEIYDRLSQNSQIMCQVADNVIDLLSHQNKSREEPFYKSQTETKQIGDKN